MHNNDSTGKLNFDLPSNLLNSTTVSKPRTDLPFLVSKSETQLTVPPVARRSSTSFEELVREKFYEKEILFRVN